MTDDPRFTELDEVFGAAFGELAAFEPQWREDEASAQAHYNAVLHRIERAAQTLDSLARDVRKAALAEAVVEAAEPFAKAGKRLIHEGNRGYRDGTFDNLYESYRFRIGDVLAIYNALAAFRAEFPADPQEKP